MAEIDPTTTEGRDALRALARQATPGPWDIEGPGPVGLLVTALHGTPVCKPYADNAAYLGSLAPGVLVSLLDQIDTLERASGTACRECVESGIDMGDIHCRSCGADL